MPVANLRVLRQMWHDNPPSVVILFGIVAFVVGYAWGFWQYGVVILAFGVILIFAGGTYEILWLRKRRNTPREP